MDPAAVLGIEIRRFEGAGLETYIRPCTRPDGAGEAGLSYSPIVIHSNGKLEFWFQSLKDKPSFDDEALRQEFLNRLNDIGRVAISAHYLERRPSIELETFAEDESFRRFVSALDWFLTVIHWPVVQDGVHPIQLDTAAVD